jgi:tetratricopeptide (TPR) repeat protein
MVTPSALTGVRNVTLQSGQSPLRNNLMVTFETTCPYCKAELTYRNIPLGQNPMGRFTARMACTKCNHRFDTPLSLHISRPENPAHRQLCDEAEQRAGAGRYGDAINAIGRVLKEDSMHERALFIGGTLLFRLSRFGDAIQWLSLAARINPLRADIQGCLASALSAAGHYFIAMLHMRQAWQLKKIADDPVRAHALQLFKIIGN